MGQTEVLFWMTGIWTGISVGISMLLAKTWRTRAPLAVILVATFFWELPFGYYKLLKLCSAEGKLRVFEEVPPQQSICVDDSLLIDARKYLGGHFQFVEARNRAGLITRIERGKGPEIIATDVHTLASSYCVLQYWESGHPWGIRRSNYDVRNELSRKIVARHSFFRWAGMWWQRELSPILGYGGECAPVNPIGDVVGFLSLGSKEFPKR